MPKVGLIVLVFALAGCAPSAASSSLFPASSPVAATALPSGSSAPEPSGACIDRGQLADAADSATTAVQGMAAAIKANKPDEAGPLAGTAATQMRSLATLVESVRPAAATGLRAAADKLDSAKANLAGAAASITAIQALFDQALQLARDGACPD